MTDSLHSYALIKALYTEGKDYLDSFWPFTIKVIPSNKSVTSSFIQEKLKQEHHLQMPLHVLEVVLARAQKLDYVVIEKTDPLSQKEYRITRSGLDYSNKLETEKEVDRRTNALVLNIKKFFKDKDIILNEKQIYDSLLRFLDKTTHVSKACTESTVKRISSTKKTKLIDRHLLDYIKSVNEHDPTNYKTLQDIVRGLIISTLLYVDDPKEITMIRTKKFDNCQVFLDTNFIFSLLGLDTKERYEAAKELIDLINKYDMNLKVFSFTVDEISRVIQIFLRESHKYPTNIRVDSIVSSLKRKDWDLMKVREFIINIEKNLKQHGITIEWISDIDLNHYSPDEELRYSMEKYKFDQTVFHQNHDLAAIIKIAELREKKVRIIEDSKSFFLTSDYRLTKFNYEEMGHKDNGTICEAISDRVLTNILWLKNPNTKPPLKLIIAAHSTDLFVNRKVWKRFYYILQNLRRENTIKDNDISTLFWHSYVEDALRSFEENDLDKITPEFVLRQIENAEKIVEESIDKRIKGIEAEKDKVTDLKLKEQEKEFVESLERTVSEAEIRKEREWLQRIQRIKMQIRERSKKTARNQSILLTLVSTIIYVVLITIGFYTLPSELLNTVISLIGGGGIIGLWGYRSKIENRFMERNNSKQLKELSLDIIPN